MSMSPLTAGSLPLKLSRFGMMKASDSLPKTGYTHEANDQNL